MEEEVPPSPTTLRGGSIGSVDHKVSKVSAAAGPGSKASSSNPRSCVTCRRRKVKCDKKHPCSNCSRAGIDCIFPAPGRAPRKPRKPAETDLAERLRRLESLVQSLGSTQGPTTDDDSSPKSPQTEVEDRASAEPEETHDEKIWRAKRELRALMHEKHERDERNPKKEDASVEDLTNRFGTLIADDVGRSRYVSPGLWASLTAAVEDIKNFISESEAEEDDFPTTTDSTSRQAYLFGLSSASVNMALLHPPEEHVLSYWQAFVENVDPLVKLFHVPQREKWIMRHARDLGKLDKAGECQMFSTYFAGVASLSEDECAMKFGEKKHDLLARYRFGMEQALARADFLRTDNAFVLQSFVVFLLCLRRYEDARYIWSMSAIAIRIAQAAGIHRDGSHYPNVNEYIKEMRRRLWWTLNQFDTRSSEDLGFDHVFHDFTSDTRMPRNLNDSDLFLEMTELPESRKGTTDMTLPLVRFEVTTVFRRVSFTPAGRRFGHGHSHHMFGHGHGSGPGPGPKHSPSPGADPNPNHGPGDGPDPGQKPGPSRRPFHDSFQHRKSMIEDLQKKLDTEYFVDADLSVPLYWLTHTISRLVMSKMWLVTYHAEQRKDGGKSLPLDIRDTLFKRSVENVELHNTFHDDERCKKFSWLLETYMQWHAIAFILNELCTRTTGPDVERAWRAIDTAIQNHAEEITKLGSHLWKPLKLLKAKAKKEREKALSQELGVSTITFTGSGQRPVTHGVPDQMMGLDLGPTRLYPSVPEADPMAVSASNIIDSWQQTNPAFTPSQTDSSSEMPDPMILSGATNMSTSMPDTLFTNNDFSPAFQSFEAVPTTWSPNEMAEPLAMDQSMNWASWDDMVQEYNIQAETPGGTKIPSFFSNGTNWY